MLRKPFNIRIGKHWWMAEELCCISSHYEQAACVSAGSDRGIAHVWEQGEHHCDLISFMA